MLAHRSPWCPTVTLELTIVVPAYNEAHRLAEGMRRLEAAAAAGAVDLDRTEVVVVDDGSTDGTAAEADASCWPRSPTTG